MVYTGSGNVPYVQFESVGDFISEPRCSKFAVGLQTRRRKIEVQEVRSDSGRRDRKRQELHYVAKCSSVCSRFEPGGSVVVY